ncbi:non-ribosomal peptide synthetase [Argonema galeatum]|uniref:non-ribosomal peptide synthetase n=1 Tax=Argonema galeatum TaxID=2942762 RepID=UPI002011103B|nr:non-ribosomal peptide synthetase [Argonema galeatum]MCL1464883.1 amino acid adenylation domain-containing protein [Argonema galeatum A003/A1]
MDDINQRIAQLSPAKRALLEQKLKEKAVKANLEQTISRTTDRTLLSFSQIRIWLVDQLEPGNAAYNRPSNIHLAGQLNVAVLEQSLNEIVRRHEILRTSFPAVDGQPVQVIAPTLTLTWPIVELSHLPTNERKAEVQRLAVQEAQHSFNLSQLPLVRATLLRLDPEEHILLLTMHHIIFDGWSMGVLLKELVALYDAFSTGKPSPLPELAIQYGDFAQWQRERLQGEVLDRQLAYWKKQLSGNLPVLELPTDRSRSAVRTFGGAKWSLLLPKNLSESLKTLSQQEGVTLFMTLLAAFQILLYRYTGQDDIIVGTPIAGRDRIETEKLIGVFINTLVLRTQIDTNSTFRELLSQVREVALRAYAHQDIPFEKLVEELHPTRNLNHTPLFQILFQLRNMPKVVVEAQGLKIEDCQLDTGTVGLDLTLDIADESEGLRCVFRYNTDLFDSVTIERMANYFQTLLESIVINSELQLLELPLLTKVERYQLARKFNDANSQVEGEDFINDRRRSNLTANQLIIWLSQQLNPDTPIYNNAVIVTILTDISPEHFQKAFQALINASDALRTIIEEIDGVPQQRVIANFPYTVEYLDFSQASDIARLPAWVNKRSQIIFNLNKCLFDCVLIKLSKNKFIVYFKTHQIIVDGLSFEFIFDYLSIFYDYSANQRLQGQLELPQFQDYIDYERTYQNSDRYFRAKAYWEQKLAEDIEPIAFYGKKIIKQTTLVKRVSYNLGVARTQKIKTIATQKDVAVNTVNTSLFNIFLAAFAVYLYKIDNNRHISIGMPLHNRRLKIFKKSIGAFVQTVPLRIVIQTDDTIFSLISRIASTTSEAIKYGQYAIVSSFQKPIYDVVLNYELQSKSEFGKAKITSESIHSGHGYESLVVKIRDWNESENLFLDFDFHQDIFDEELQGLAIQHFMNVLDSLLESINQPIANINLLSPGEKERICFKFNQAKAEFPIDQTIPQLFEAQVQKTPDWLAVVFKDQTFTYAQLNAKANQLAHYLQSLGVKPEVLVGLCVERSPEMIVGLLGILKAGGVYVPLDPTYPTERLNYMVSDAQISLLLTQEKFQHQFTAKGVYQVCLERDKSAIAQESKANPVSHITPNNLSYVIYTSGSTGKPKGVMIEHRSLVNFTQAAISEYGLNERDSPAETLRDRVLQFASISFDTAAEEIYPCLTSGGTLVLRTEEMLTSVATFLKTCQDLQLTVLDLPTAYWQLMVSELGTTDVTLPESLRLVIIGGERVLPESVKMWQKCIGDYPQLVNTYGPTEATVVATTYRVAASTPIKKEVPIGRAIVNVQIYVLDRNLQPVPIGIPGELHIGGIGLARGYLNRLDLTQEKFIPNPFSNAPQARLYKTGDRVRYLSDGNIEFLGRIDNQVKIRGFRIELGEIETVLTQYPGVREAVVILKEEQSGNKPLIAYVVCDREQLTPTELYSFLQTKLPEYMMPSAFVRLEKLPLTPNGKVDRRALPSPEIEDTLSTNFVSPRTSTEQQLADIWSSLLKVKRVGIHDNFFELGGHSLLATQVVSRIQKAFEVELRLRDLFESPTIAQLSDRIETILWAKSGQRSSTENNLEQGEL